MLLSASMTVSDSGIGGIAEKLPPIILSFCVDEMGLTYGNLYVLDIILPSLSINA